MCWWEYVYRAGCDSGSCGVIVIGIIIIVIITIIIIIIICIMGVRGGVVLCRWMHRIGGCWFFRGGSCHPRVDLFECHGAGGCWELVVVSWL